MSAGVAARRRPCVSAMLLAVDQLQRAAMTAADRDGGAVSRWLSWRGTVDTRLQLLRPDYRPHRRTATHDDRSAIQQLCMFLCVMACSYRKGDSFVWSPIVFTPPTRQFCLISTQFRWVLSRRVGGVNTMRLFSEIGGATLEGAGSERGCQFISKNILNAWNHCSVTDFACAANFLHIAIHS